MRFRIDPGYVLDRMEPYEIRAILTHSHLMDREDWERTRLIGFVTANAAGADLKNFQDLVTFPWEEQKPEKIELTPEQQAAKWEECRMVAKMLTAELLKRQ